MAYPTVDCKRYPSESCLLPQRILYRLPTGKNGCMRVSFSSSGKYLAAACCDKMDFPIRIYDIDNGTFFEINCNTKPYPCISKLGNEILTMKGHNAVVYCLSWSTKDDKLLSASSDGTAKFWNINIYEKQERYLYRNYKGSDSSAIFSICQCQK